MSDHHERPLQSLPALRRVDHEVSGRYPAHAQLAAEFSARRDMGVHAPDITRPEQGFSRPTNLPVEHPCHNQGHQLGCFIIQLGPESGAGRQDESHKRRPTREEIQSPINTIS
jgi:hypothetical protein